MRTLTQTPHPEALLSQSASAPGISRQSRTVQSWLTLSLFFGLATASNAAAIVVPPGLNPGDTYRIVFVTSTARHSSSTNIADYNSFVTAAANLDTGLASLSTTWSALASTSAVNALSNAGLTASDTTTRFFNTAGQLIATGVAVPGSGLYGGTTTAHAAPIRTQAGNLLSESSFSDEVWTGTSSDGSTSPFAWLGEHTPPITTVIGFANSVSGTWTIGSARQQFADKHLYGVSDELTVGVPEPSTLAMLGGAMIALARIRLRRVRPESAQRFRAST